MSLETIKNDMLPYKFYSVDTETEKISVSTVIKLLFDTDSGRSYMVFENNGRLYVRQYFCEIQDKIYFKVYNQEIREQILSLVNN